MRILFPMLLALLVSCAAVDAPPSLYGAFSGYAESVKNGGNSQDYLRYYSEKKLSGVDLDNPQNQEQLMFATYMTEIASHVEKISGNGGCLTVNGFDISKEPVSFYIAYDKSQREWLISDIHVAFLESPSEFSNEAKCPANF